MSRTVWAPSETLAISRTAAEAVPRTRAARVLRVVDRFAATAIWWGANATWRATTAGDLVAYVSGLRDNAGMRRDPSARSPRNLKEGSLERKTGFKKAKNCSDNLMPDGSD